ncbi:MAG: hypothetical protein WBN40_02215 [Pseudomonadales bacterium]
MQNDRRRLAHFSISAVVFFTSCAMLYWIEKRAPGSLEQELQALFFLALATLSFGWSIAMHLLHIYAKLRN